MLYTPTSGIAASVPITLLMLQSITLPIGGYWNGPLWQVSALMLCYLAFPLLLRRLQKQSTEQLQGLLMILATVALLLPLTVIGVVHGAGAGFVGATFIHTFGPFRILQFSIGVVGGLLARNGEACSPLSRLNVMTICLLACQVATLAVVGSMSEGSTRFQLWMILNYFAEYALPLLQVRWIMALTTTPRGIVAAFLQLPVLHWLGDASYAIFCLHWPVVMWSGWAVAGRGITAEAMPLSTRESVEGWFAFPGWAVPILLLVCVAIGGLAEKLLGSSARRARKSAVIGAAGPAGTPAAEAPADAVTNSATEVAEGDRKSVV